MILPSFGRVLFWWFKIIIDNPISSIKLDNVSKSFYKHNNCVNALSELNCEITENSISGLIGLNGAGKTTLLRLLAGIYQLSSGKISLFGQKAEYFIKQNPHSIGYLSFDTQVYHKLTIREYLNFFAKINGLAKLSINNKIKHYAERMNFYDDLDTLLENVSTGTRQKLAFTSIILHHPKLLLLDEPFSNIDIMIVEEMLLILNELKNQGSTIIISSHNMYEIDAISENILLLNKGKLLCFETMNNLKIRFPQWNLKQIILKILEQNENPIICDLATN